VSDNKKIVNLDVFQEESALMIAIKYKNIEIIKTLIEAGADVNAVAYRSQPHMGSTALKYAIDANSVEIVEILLNAGANANVLVDGGLFDLIEISRKEEWQNYAQNHDVRNNPILSYAISRHCSKEIAQALINAGADVNGTSPLWGYDWTALMI